MLLLTLRGTPTIYYGDEIGLSDVSIPYDQVQDPRELREPGLALGRDPVRTHMPWNAHPFAGFSSVRSEEHTSELQSLMRKPYAVSCWNKKIQNNSSVMECDEFTT